MRAGITRDDIGSVYLTNLTPPLTTLTNPIITQKLYIKKPTRDQVTRALSEIPVGLSSNTIREPTTYDTTVPGDNLFWFRNGPSASFQSFELSQNPAFTRSQFVSEINENCDCVSAYIFYSTLVGPIRRGKRRPGPIILPPFRSTIVLISKAPNTGIGAYLEVDNTRGFGVFTFPITTVASPTLDDVLGVIYPAPATIDVSDSSLLSIMPGINDVDDPDAIITRIAELVAPKIVFTGDVAWSLYNDGLMEFVSSDYSIHGITGPAIILLENDGVTPFVL